MFGSAGLLEIAVNRGNAARTFCGVNRGAEVTLDLEVDGLQPADFGSASKRH